ncbi:MAG TPA: HEAT repeat domain-containing protein [Anaeromyxobacteraceae bacterium]|nr:HEAT repeat domain-containing protein [Anaeromyxobacteraceae bacterium]
MDQTDARFNDFFRELAVAGRALASYPPGHPAAVSGLAKACSALEALIAAAGPLELAAARDALLWSEKRFTSPAAAQLAKLLRRRGAAGVLLDGSVTPGELEVFLRALTRDARSLRPGDSLAAELDAAGLTRIRAQDLDFSSIALVDADEELSASEAGAFEDRLVRRLVAAGSLRADQVTTWASSGRSSTDLVNFLLDGGPGGAARASRPLAVAALSRAAAEDFCESPDAGRAASVASLYGRLGSDGGSRLLQELGAAISRSGSGREAMALVAAVFSPEVAAELGRMIGEPPAAAQGESPSPDAAATARASQLASLRSTFASEDVDAFRDVEVPMDGLAGLLDLPEVPAGIAVSAEARAIAREAADPGAERDIAGTMLEIVEHAGLPPEALPQVLRRLEGNYLRLLSARRMEEALALVEAIHWGAIGDGPVPAAFKGLAEWMSGQEAVQALVAALPDLNAEAIGRVPALIENLEPAAVRQLLEILAEAEDRRLRFLLLDVLSKLGGVVARDAAAMLADPRWYVVRNMLLILRRIGDSKSVPAVRRCAAHADLRVRLEAIHNLFAFDREGSRELLRQALNNADLREAQEAMALAGKYGIAEAVEPIVAYLRAWDPFGKRRPVRLEAIRALGAIRDPRALDGLERFRARLFPPALEERRELYRTLSSYPREAISAWIEGGLKSRDVEIRWLCEALNTRPGVAP